MQRSKAELAFQKMVLSVLRMFVILVAFTLSASATTVLFSNLTEAGLGYGPDGFGLGNRLQTLPPGFYAVAATRFSVSKYSILQAIQVPVGVWTGVNDLPAYLFADDLGAPGAAIESFMLSDVPSLPSDHGIPLTTAVSALRPLLKANTSYWFAVYGTPDMDANWQFTTFQGIPTGSTNFAARILGGIETEWQVDTGGAGAREGAMVIIGEAVPEPQSGMLIAVGLLVLGGMRQFRTLRMCEVKTRIACLAREPLSGGLRYRRSVDRIAATVHPRSGKHFALNVRVRDPDGRGASPPYAK